MVVLLALSPYVVRYSTEARMYSLVMVLVLVGGVLVLDALESPTPALVAIAVVAALLVYTQYWAFYLLAALVLVLLWRWRVAPGRPDVVRIVAALAVGGASASCCGCRPSSTSSPTPARRGRPRPAPTQVVADTFVDLGGGGLGTFSEGILFGLLIALLVAVGVLTARPAPGRTPASPPTATPSRELAAVAFGTLAIGAIVGFLTGPLQQPVRLDSGPLPAGPGRGRDHPIAPGLAHARVRHRGRGAGPHQQWSRRSTAPRAATSRRSSSNGPTRRRRARLPRPGGGVAGAGLRQTEVRPPVLPTRTWMPILGSSSGATTPSATTPPTRRPSPPRSSSGSTAPCGWSATSTTAPSRAIMRGEVAATLAAQREAPRSRALAEACGARLRAR